MSNNIIPYIISKPELFRSLVNLTYINIIIYLKLIIKEKFKECKKYKIERKLISYITKVVLLSY